MSFTAIPDPDGTREICPDCRQITVLVTTATGAERVHCGTYTARCDITPRRSR